MKKLVTSQTIENWKEADKINALQKIQAKLKAGKSLNTTERKILDEMEVQEDVERSRQIDGSVIVKTKKRIAQVFEVNARTVTRWQKEGMPVMPDGTYNLLAIQLWIEKRRPELNNNADSEIDETILDLRKKWLKLRNKKMEIEVREKEGEYFKRDVVIKGWIERIEIVKRGLMNLPLSIGPLIAPETDPRKCREIIEMEVRDLLGQFAEGGKKYNV